MKKVCYRQAVAEVRQGKRYLDEVVGRFLKERRKLELEHLINVGDLIKKYYELQFHSEDEKYEDKLLVNNHQEENETEEDIFYDALESWTEPMLEKQAEVPVVELSTIDAEKIDLSTKSQEEKLQTKPILELEDLQDGFR